MTFFFSCKSSSFDSAVNTVVRCQDLINMTFKAETAALVQY